MHPSSCRRTRFTLSRILLPGPLLLLPVLAIAGLADFDLHGTARAVPTTMGALEVASNDIGLSAPRGLTIIVQRIGA